VTLPEHRAGDPTADAAAVSSKVGNEAAAACASPSRGVPAAAAIHALLPTSSKLLPAVVAAAVLSAAAAAAVEAVAEAEAEAEVAARMQAIAPKLT